VTTQDGPKKSTDLTIQFGDSARGRGRLSRGSHCSELPFDPSTVSPDPDNDTNQHDAPSTTFNLETRIFSHVGPSLVNDNYATDDTEAVSADDKALDQREVYEIGDNPCVTQRPIQVPVLIDDSGDDLPLS
jgi:hypothetical protein